MDRTCSGTSHRCSIRLGSGEFGDQIKTSGGVAERIVLLLRQEVVFLQACFGEYVLFCYEHLLFWKTLKNSI